MIEKALSGATELAVIRGKSIAKEGNLGVSIRAIFPKSMGSSSCSYCYFSFVKMNMPSFFDN